MKFSIYNNVIEKENGLILANTKIGTYIKIFKDKELNEIKTLLRTNEFSQNSDIVKTLYQLGCIVDDEVDEYEEQRKRVEEYYKKWDKVLKLIIFTTDHCNFRCIYCPAENLPKKFSDTKWKSLYRFIKKGVEQEAFEKIHITFFGGEPLLESKKIIEFLEKMKNLKENNPHLLTEYNIVSNGYLLTPTLFEKLISLGLTQYQITVDGFAETHNITRPRLDGEGTWHKVVENLKYINSTKHLFEIDFRTNVNNINIDTLEKFHQWFQENFDSKRFLHSVVQVSKYTELVKDELLYSPSPKNDKLMSDINGGIQDSHPLKFLSQARYCCWKHSYTLNTDAQITKCDNDFCVKDGCIIGYLDDDGNFVFEKDINPWIENFETEECKTCSLYPLCAGRTCPKRKVFSTKTRTDCQLIKETLLKNIELACV